MSNLDSSVKYRVRSVNEESLITAKGNITMATVRKIIAAAVVAGAIAISAVGQADAAPVRPIKSIVVSPAGGQGDWPLAK